MSSEESSSSSEDEEFQLNEQFERDFLKTLSLLKNKDPTIYNEETKFFSENSTVVVGGKSKKGKKTDEHPSKPFTIAEYEKKIYLDNDATNNEAEIKQPKKNEQPSYVEEQKELKESFKQFLNDEGDGETENDSLLKVRVKTAQENEREEADYIQWMKGQIKDLEDKDTEKKLKPLHDYWNSTNLDQNEAYLRDFILNKQFLNNEKSDSDDDNGGVQSDDSSELEEIEDFEQKFNNRFENEESQADLIKRYPRTIEGSLRRKNEKRKKKREEIRERKEKDKRKKRDEINKQKNIKSKEIHERLEELKKLTGNEKLAFKDEDIMEDFDSDIFDKKMSQMYNEEFYSKEDEEKPRIDDIEGLDQYGNDEEGFTESMHDQDIDMDCESGPSYRERKLTRTKKKKKDKKKKSFIDFTLQEDKPLFDPKLHESYDKFMDEYYQLDCEDFIGELPTRYKYKSVEPNDFGLSVDEILIADDKELNQWSSVKKLTKIRPDHVDKNEAMMYKKKAQNQELKKKLLPSLFKSLENEDKEKEVEKVPEADQATSSEMLPPKSEPIKKKRKPWFKPDGNQKKHSFHDSRLEAYGINPKKFKPK